MNLFFYVFHDYITRSAIQAEQKCHTSLEKEGAFFLKMYEMCLYV